MLEEFEKFLAFAVRRRETINTFCWCMIGSAIIIGLGGGIFSAAILENTFFAKFFVGLALFIAIVAGILAIFTGDFKEE